ncbi:hypothetical protein CSOJ01_01663 [Colletotrichum sojae]|uniref:Uncharacterized protein n=1 Tax=Colletotrichum sojae TaxID=2175907 RepID=A0A8H6JT55_9PEZI|nr:hypothetical protein CSOJ01_01663 [Colletotrichum sojae]
MERKVAINAYTHVVTPLAPTSSIRSISIIIIVPSGVQLTSMISQPVNPAARDGLDKTTDKEASGHADVASTSSPSFACFQLNKGRRRRTSHSGPPHPSRTHSARSARTGQLSLTVVPDAFSRPNMHRKAETKHASEPPSPCRLSTDENTTLACATPQTRRTEAKPWPTELKYCNATTDGKRRWSKHSPSQKRRVHQAAFVPA